MHRDSSPSQLGSAGLGPAPVARQVRPIAPRAARMLPGQALECVLLVGRTSGPMSSSDIQRLLLHAWRSNSIHGTTGVLLSSEGQVLHYLEGQPDRLTRAIAELQSCQPDLPARLVYRATICRRRFAGWAVASKTADFSEYSSTWLQDFLMGHPSSLVTDPSEALTHAIAHGWRRGSARKLQSASRMASGRPKRVA